MSTVGWIIIQQSIYCHSGPLLMQVLIRTGRSVEGCWCGWEHFAHTHHFSQKLKLFGKYMNFFFNKKNCHFSHLKRGWGVQGGSDDFTTSHTWGTSCSSRSSSWEHGASVPFSRYTWRRTGEEPRDLSGALIGKLETLPSDAQMPQLVLKSPVENVGPYCGCELIFPARKTT